MNGAAQASPWVWTLANVTAKASCTRSPWVCSFVNGMFNAAPPSSLVWSFDFFSLRDMSNEVWVSGLLSQLFIEWRLCIDGVDWLFLFASCFLIGSFSWLLLGWWTLDSANAVVNNPAIGLVGDLIANSPNVRSSIRLLCTITLRKDIQYIQAICIHYVVFKHSWYDYVAYCYTVHLELNSSPINTFCIYIYIKVTLHLTRLVTGSIYRGCINPFLLSSFSFFSNYIQQGLHSLQYMALSTFWCVSLHHNVFLRSGKISGSTRSTSFNLWYCSKSKETPWDEGCRLPFIQ